jgi:RNA binding exosome subunit
VGLHHITWRATASALSNADVLAEAMSWLIGDEEAVELDRSTSYHGPELTLITASTANKRKALQSFTKLGKANLEHLQKEMVLRMDEQHVLHFRLTIDSVVEGKPKLAIGSAAGTVKGQAKFEVYSGLTEEEQLRNTFIEARELLEGN